MGERWLWVPLALAAASVVAAFAIPLTFFPDATDVDPQRIRRLETEARHWTSLPALRVQTVEAWETGPMPDHVAGRVVFRGIFGVAWGEITQEDGQGHADWRIRRQMMVWGGVVGVLLLLGWWEWRLLWF